MGIGFVEFKYDVWLGSLLDAALIWLLNSLERMGC